MALTKGVPWDVVMAMDDIERAGFCIALGIAEGGKFNFASMQWEKPNA